MPSNPDDRSHDDDARPGSDRGFGAVMAAASCVIGGFKLWHASRFWWVWLALAAAFGAAAWLSPALLRPLNYLWFRFGLLLHRIVSPIAMAVIFFGAVLPVGLLMRLFGNQPLAPKFDPRAGSYWIARKQGTPPPGSMKNQF